MLAFAAPPSQGNTVLTKDHGPVYGVEAAVRLGALIGDGKRVMQPVGFGAGLTLRAHALHLGPLRLGGMLRLGHTRFLRRATLLSGAAPGAGEVQVWSALSHSEFALGPSLQVVLGPVLFEGGVGAGLGISSLVRPLGPTIGDEEHVSDYTAVVVGGGQLGIPIRNNQGLVLGASTHKYFSRKQVVSSDDLDDPTAEPSANPFDLVLDVYVGFQMWF